MTVRNIDMTARVRMSPIARTYRRNINPADPYPNTTGKAVSNFSLVPQDYLIKNGFPFTPDLQVTSDAVLSAEGLYVPDDTYPWEAVFQGAHSRFLAQENLWDDVGVKWVPLYTSGADYYFTWPVGGVVPRLEEIEYQIGKKLYRQNSIRIDEETHLQSSFNNDMDDASSFMIAMAGVINSNSKASLLRVGDTMGDSIEVSVDEHLYLRNQYGTGTLKPTTHPGKMIPFYMVLINDPSRTELRVASGTERIYSMTIPNRDAARSLIVNIGEDVGGSKTLSFNLFEVTLFPYAYGGEMTVPQIINTMASIYGSGR